MFTPSVLECVDIESDTNVYKLQIRESLYSALRFQTVGAHEIAYVEARMNFPKDASVPLLEQVPNSQHAHDPLLLSEGNVKLDAVKQLLAREGYDSHFRGGMLVCSDGVVLRRTQANSITVEGIVSEKYFEIRSLLYQHYTLL